MSNTEFLTKELFVAIEKQVHLDSTNNSSPSDSIFVLSRLVESVLSLMLKHLFVNANLSFINHC